MLASIKVGGAATEMEMAEHLERQLANISRATAQRMQIVQHAPEVTNAEVVR